MLGVLFIPIIVENCQTIDVSNDVIGPSMENKRSIKIMNNEKIIIKKEKEKRRASFVFKIVRTQIYNFNFRGLTDIKSTGPDDTVAKSSAISLVGTRFASWYQSGFFKAQ